MAPRGAQGRLLPHGYPRWGAVYQQTPRWLRATGFADSAHDLRLLRRRAPGRTGRPGAVILDGRTVVRSSPPESGAEAGSDGHNRRQGRTVPLAVDTVGQLLAAVIPPANERERGQVAELAALGQAVTGQTVELAYVDQGHTGDEPAAAAAAPGPRLAVITLPNAAAAGPTQGFVLLPRRWVVERSAAWLARFRRLARDDERLLATVAGLTFLAFTCLMVHQVIHLPRRS